MAKARRDVKGDIPRIVIFVRRRLGIQLSKLNTEPENGPIIKKRFKIPFSNPCLGSKNFFSGMWIISSHPVLKAQANLHSDYVTSMDTACGRAKA